MRVIAQISVFVVLTGWTLFFLNTKTHEDDCDTPTRICADTLEGTVDGAAPVQYPTKGECEKAAAAYQRQFHRDLKASQRVGTMETKCTEPVYSKPK